jgi:hypothetical protein
MSLFGDRGNASHSPDDADRSVARRRSGRLDWPGRNEPLATLGLGLLLAWQLWLIIHHSFWRDELQAYLLVRDSPGLDGLFANLRYEGHPSLWYLLLAGAEAIVRSPAALVALQVVVTLAAAAIVWLRAPFPAWLRLLILAGYFPLFEYGVIVRSYGLGAMLLWAWLPLRRTIWGWLILALMANVAVHFALLSACCAGAMVLIERRWSWAGLALWGAGGLCAVATILPPHDLTTGMNWAAFPLDIRFRDTVSRLAAIAYPHPLDDHVWQSRYIDPLGSEIGLIGIAAWPIAAWRDRRAAGLQFALILALALLSVLLYPTYPRHVGVVVLFGVAVEWMWRERTAVDRESPGARPPLLFLTLIGVNAASGLLMAFWALSVPFSPGRQEVDWIAAHHLDRARWAAYPGYMGSDVAAYFNRPVYNLQQQRLGTFVRWNAHAYDRLDATTLAARLIAPGPFDYLASEDDLAYLHAPLRRLAHFDSGMAEKGVFLYAIERPADGR